MNAKLRNPRSLYLFAAIAALVLCVDTVTARIAPQDRLLAYAVLFDFVVVIPFCYWLLVIRNSGKKLKSLLPFPLLGAIAAWFALPASVKSMAWDVIWPVELAIVAIEASLIYIEIRLLIAIVKQIKERKRTEPDTVEAIRHVCKDRLGDRRIGSFIAHDVAMFYYFFFSWGKRKRDKALAIENANVYTYHRETNQVLLAAFVTKLIVLESVVVHLLLAMWSPLVAWIVTISELWLLILLWADTRAAVMQPIRIGKEGIRLRYGLRLQADFRWENLLSVDWAKSGYELTGEEKRQAASPAVGTPNVRLALKSEQRVDGFFFQPMRTSLIYLAIDRPSDFVAEANRFLNEDSENLS
ncbi:hypothetical protein [Paenibacillus sp. NPDC058071]|uniref:hypothetical protein n=1 Tax=Paenibacillus sp. NPDC058071 TaxID=3346326 RepID=UPI0036DBBD85